MSSFREITLTLAEPATGISGKLLCPLETHFPSTLLITSFAVGPKVMFFSQVCSESKSPKSEAHKFINVDSHLPHSGLEEQLLLEFEPRLKTINDDHKRSDTESSADNLLSLGRAKQTHSINLCPVIS